MELLKNLTTGYDKKLRPSWNGNFDLSLYFDTPSLSNFYRCSSMASEKPSKTFETRISSVIKSIFELIV